ncbi:UTP--glucose-1-phosphate uridylyltransferase [Paraconexibacter sp. AEG42_29]|uniref:UTP--glucose-1-phosphate uridylyltransferase n=1 Tax=Paraconexibacter sp. AEG42_29 TaxID=2997339 RepID=UPI00339D39F8
MTEPEALLAAEKKLRADGAGEVAVQTFLKQLARVHRGERGELTEAQIEPVTSLPDAEDIDEPSPERATALLDETVVIKLNGGLGTSMGLDGPKSLLPVKDGLTFLDVIARQVLHLREKTGARLPLVLMNSFATREDSLAALDAYPELAQDVPRDFLQNKVPKLRADDLLPIDWPADPALEWAPPGHGDVYAALTTSGMLAKLIDAGYHYAFVSNADNLGAAVSKRLLSWFAGTGAPFAMEVADRTAADRKGGHLARRVGPLRAGGLVLRELAQTPDADVDAFQDVDRYRYFNTNNLWIDLRALATTLDGTGGVLELPLIVNAKTVDPKDDDSTPVLQLETAMGSAIDALPGAVAIRVPRIRFGPVKATSDLLAVRSDAYVLGQNSRLVLDKRRLGLPPVLELDSEYYKLVESLDAHFPEGSPSLVDCARLRIDGSVTFGADVVVRGDVVVHGPQDLPAGTVLDGTA